MSSSLVAIFGRVAAGTLRKFPIRLHLYLSIPMQLDDELCLCFHVTRRKVVNFVRIEKPRSAAQLAECFGAGTGCGWCRPFLRQIFEAARDERRDAPLPSSEDYARRRRAYVRQGNGTPPPGATPIERDSAN